MHLIGQVSGFILLILGLWALLRSGSQNTYDDKRTEYFLTGAIFLGVAWKILF